MQSSSRHLGTKPILWVLDSTGHSLRQSMMMMMMIIIIIIMMIMNVVVFVGVVVVDL
jgi:hypothetical protein